MGRLYSDISWTVGNTPLVKLNRVAGMHNPGVYAKLESFNPMSSVKDRIGIAMIEEAEKAGKIQKDTVIIEATSGNRNRPGFHLRCPGISPGPRDA